MKRATNSLPWWHSAVLYDIYPRSFADGDSDGFGDLQGVASKLDYLRFVLGVDAILLRPFTAHTGFAPVFGTMKDFDKLLTQARRRDLRVVVDFVPNRTSEQHPWFLASRSSRHDPQRDWYVWADPLAPDGRPPSNWTDETGGSSWTYHWDSDQYYLHSFHRRQPITNWRSPGLRQAILDTLGFWLDKGVDGILVDITHTAAPEPLLNTARRGPIDLRPLARDAKPLSDQLAADAYTCMRTIRQALAEYGRRTGRHVAAIDQGEMTRQDQWDRFPDSATGTHLPFNAALTQTPWTAASLAENVATTEAALPPQAWPRHSLSHHDKPRPATTLGADNARVAALLLLTLRGMPTLYYGDELGLPNLRLGPGDPRDPLKHHRSRAPMAWNGSPDGGFSRRPIMSPWLPPTEPVQRYNVEAQLADQASLLNLYRRLLAVRRRTPALRVGSYRSVADAPTDCLCFVRSTGGQSVFVAVNLGHHAQEIGVPVGGRTLVDTSGLPSADTFIKRLRLEPHSGAVVRLETSG